MASTLLLCGFECKVDSTGGHWFNNTGTTAIETTKVHGGGSANSMKVTCNGSVGSSCGMALNLTANARFVTRFFFMVDALPAANAEFYRAIHGTASVNVHLGFEQSSGKLCIYPQNNFAGRVLGPVIIAGTWYCIDFNIDGTGQTADWRVGTGDAGVAQTQLAIGGSAGTFDYSLYGHQDSTTVAFTAYTGYFDDAMFSQTSGDYPLTQDHILGYVPFADGAHSTGTAGNFTDGATNITDATTTAWTLLDERPPTSTDKVVGAAIAASNYVEVRFNSTTVNETPLAVDFTTAWRAATAASAAGSIKMRDNLGATDDAIFTTTIALASDVYFTKHYAARPAALGAWTAAALNDVRARVGFVTDATPNIWFGGIVMEAAFAPGRVPYRSIYPQLLPQ